MSRPLTAQRRWRAHCGCSRKTDNCTEACVVSVHVRAAAWHPPMLYAPSSLHHRYATCIRASDCDASMTGLCNMRPQQSHRMASRSLMAVFVILASQIIAASAGSTLPRCPFNNCQLWKFDPVSTISSIDDLSLNLMIRSDERVITACRGLLQLMYIDAFGEVYGYGYGSSVGVGGNGYNPNGVTYGAPTIGIEGFATKVYCGRDFSMVITSAGRVFTTGANTYGQLGDGTTTSTSTFIEVPGLTDIVDGAAGYYSGYAINSTGHVFAWGRNQGDLAIGTTTAYETTPQLINLQDVVQVQAGNRYVVFQTVDGSTYAAGYKNSNGEQATGGASTATAPVLQSARSPSGTPMIIATGNDITMIAHEDGNIFAAGDGRQGALGLGFYTGTLRRYSWSTVGSSPWAHIASICIADQFTMLAANGTLYVAGEIGGLNFPSFTAVPQQPFYAYGVVCAGDDPYVLLSADIHFEPAASATPTVNASPSPSPTTSRTPSSSPPAQTPSATPSQPVDITGFAPIMDRVCYEADGCTAVLHAMVLSSVSVRSICVGQTNWYAYINTAGELYVSGTVNTYGQLGLGHFNSQSAAVHNTFLTKPGLAVLCGANHMLVLDEEGTVWSAGEMPYAAGHESESKITLAPIPYFTEPIVDIVTSASGSLAMGMSGAIYGWGDNTNNMLGIGQYTVADYYLVGTVDISEPVVSMAVGDESSYFLLANGTLLAIGGNSKGQLSTGNTVTSTSFVEISNPGGSTIVGVAAGSKHLLFWNEDGEIYGVGDNTKYQLGYIASNAMKTSPYKMTGFGTASGKTVTYASSNSGTSVNAYTSIVTQEGEVYLTSGSASVPYFHDPNSGAFVRFVCTGSTRRAYLTGNAPPTPSATPSPGIIPSSSATSTPSPSIGAVVGQIYEPQLISPNWGSQTTQFMSVYPTISLGHPVFNTKYFVATDRSVRSMDDPNQIHLNNVERLFVCDGHDQNTFALTVNGEVWAIGANLYGSLGIESTEGTDVWTRVNSLATLDSPVIKVALSPFTALFLTADGQVYGTGDNTFGAMGTDTFTSTNVPVLLSPGGTVVDIAAGYTHSALLMSTGTIKTAGSNQRGEAATSDVGPFYYWKDVSLASGSAAPAKIFAGDYKTVYMDEDQQAYYTGTNNYKECGCGYNGNQFGFRVVDYSYPQNPSPPKLVDVALPFGRTYYIGDDGRLFRGGNLNTASYEFGYLEAFVYSPGYARYVHQDYVLIGPPLPSASASASASNSASPTMSSSSTGTATTTSTSSGTPSVTPTNSASSSASPTSSVSATSSATPTSSVSTTSTVSPSPTVTATTSATPSATASVSATGSATRTVSPSQTATTTASSTSTVSSSNSATTSVSMSATTTSSKTASVSASSSVTASRTASNTATATASESSGASASSTPAPSVSSSVTASNSATPSDTASKTASSTVSPTPSSSATATVSGSRSQTATKTATPSETMTSTADPSVSSTETSSRSASVTPTSSRTPTASRTASSSPSSSGSRTPSSSATPSASLSVSASESAASTPSETSTPTASHSAGASSSSTPLSTPSASKTATTSVSPSSSATTSRSASSSVSSSETASLTASMSAVVTPSASSDPTASSTVSPSMSPSMTPSASAVSTPSETSTPSPSHSSGASASSTPVSTPSSSKSAAMSVTPSFSATVSETASVSVSVSAVATPSASADPTSSETAAVTVSSTSGPSPTSSSSAVVTPTSSASGTSSYTPVSTPSSSMTPTPSHSSGASASSTPVPSRSSTESTTLTPSASGTMSPTSSHTVSPSSSVSTSASVSAMSTPSSSPTPSASHSAGASASATPVPSNSPTETASTTSAPTLSKTPSSSSSPSVSASLSASQSGAATPLPSDSASSTPSISAVPSTTATPPGPPMALSAAVHPVSRVLAGSFVRFVLAIENMDRGEGEVHVFCNITMAGTGSLNFEDVISFLDLQTEEPGSPDISCGNEDSNGVLCRLNLPPTYRAELVFSTDIQSTFDLDALTVFAGVRQAGVSHPAQDMVTETIPVTRSSTIGTAANEHFTLNSADCTGTSTYTFQLSTAGYSAIRSIDAAGYVVAGTVVGANAGAIAIHTAIADQPHLLLCDVIQSNTSFGCELNTDLLETGTDIQVSIQLTEQGYAGEGAVLALTYTAGIAIDSSQVIESESSEVEVQLTQEFSLSVPTGLRCAALSDGTLELRWEAVTGTVCQSETISEYDVGVIGSTSVYSIDAEGLRSTSHILSSVIPGREYALSVRSRLGSHVGEFASPVRCTPTGQTTGADVYVEFVGDHQIIAGGASESLMLYVGNSGTETVTRFRLEINATEGVDISISNSTQAASTDCNAMSSTWTSTYDRSMYSIEFAGTGGIVCMISEVDGFFLELTYSAVAMASGTQQISAAVIADGAVDVVLANNEAAVFIPILMETSVSLTNITTTVAGGVVGVAQENSVVYTFENTGNSMIHPTTTIWAASLQMSLPNLLKTPLTRVRTSPSGIVTCSGLSVQGDVQCVVDASANAFAEPWLPGDSVFVSLRFELEDDSSLVGTEVFSVTLETTDADDAGSQQPTSFSPASHLEYALGLPPLSPAAVYCGTSTESSVDVTYDVADGRGSPLINYEVAYDNGGGLFPQIITSLCTSASPDLCMASNLAPNTTYTFGVRATNEYGTSAWSPVTTCSTAARAVQSALYPATAVFNRFGNVINVAFSSDTDSGRVCFRAMTAQERCARMWDSGSQSLFGEGAGCTFTEAHRLRIVLGSGATVRPGDIVTVVDDCVRNARGSRFANGSVVVANPANGAAPKTLISGSGQVPFSAQQRRLDASSSDTNGRSPRSITWELLPLSGNSSATYFSEELFDWFANQTDEIVDVPTSLLPPGAAVRVRVEVENFLWASDAKEFSLERLAFDAPEIQMESSPDNVQPSQGDYLIRTSVQRTGHAATDAVMFYRWSIGGLGVSTSSTGSQSVMEQRLADANAGQGKKNFLFPVSEYPPRSSVTMTVVACYESIHCSRDMWPSLPSSCQCSTAEEEVEVTTEMISLDFPGGTTRVVRRDEPFTLSVVPNDPNCVSSATCNSSLWWYCEVTDGRGPQGVPQRGCNPSEVAGLLATSESSVLMSNVDGYYRFSLTYTNLDYDMQAKGYVYLEVTYNQNIPLVALSSSGNSGDLSSVDAGAVIAFTATATFPSGEPEDVVYDWTIASDADQLIEQSWSACLLHGEASGSTPTIVIEPNCFQSDVDYEVSVFVRNALNNAGFNEGYASLQLRTNSPPASGFCRALPSTVGAFEAVLMHCLQWVDADQPLWYKFDRVTSHNQLVSLGPGGTTNALTTSFPNVSPISREIRVRATISDTRGMENTYDFVVRVNPASVSGSRETFVRDKVSGFLTSVNSSASDGNAEGAARDIRSIAELADDASRSGVTFELAPEQQRNLKQKTLSLIGGDDSTQGSSEADATLLRQVLSVASPSEEDVDDIDSSIRRVADRLGSERMSNEAYNALFESASSVGAVNPQKASSTAKLIGNSAAQKMLPGEQVEASTEFANMVVGKKTGSDRTQTVSASPAAVVQGDVSISSLTTSVSVIVTPDIPSLMSTTYGIVSTLFASTPVEDQTTYFSDVVSVSLTNSDGDELNSLLGSLHSPMVVEFTGVIDSTRIPDGHELQCVHWSASAETWSSSHCVLAVAVDSSSATCSCSSFTADFYAVAAMPAHSESGLSVPLIAGIAVGAAVAVVAAVLLIYRSSAKGRRPVAATRMEPSTIVMQVVNNSSKPSRQMVLPSFTPVAAPHPSVPVSPRSHNPIYGLPGIQ